MLSRAALNYIEGVFRPRSLLAAYRRTPQSVALGASALDAIAHRSRFLVIALCLALPAAAFAESARGRRGGRTRAARPGKARPAVKPQPPPEPTSPERRADDAPRPTAKGGDDDRDLKRGERVEFDGRLIEGQTAASGAIYLFERLPSELRSMVTERRSYQREILETLYPNGAVPPAEPRADKAPR